MSRIRTTATLVVVIVATALTTACDQAAVEAELAAPAAFQDRFPIRLENAPVELDVYPSRAYGLDARQREDILRFAAAYTAATKSVISIMVPNSPDPTKNILVDRTLQATIKTLASARIARSHLAISSYDTDPLGDPVHVEPLRLSFVALRAGVPAECGQWPTDLASGSSTIGFENRSYWNFGCAAQSNIAVQTAEPLDLVRKRPIGQPDIVTRTNAIEALRQGRDPSTKFDTEAQSVSDAQ